MRFLDKVFRWLANLFSGGRHRWTMMTPGEKRAHLESLASDLGPRYGARGLKTDPRDKDLLKISGTWQERKVEVCFEERAGRISLRIFTQGLRPGTTFTLLATPEHPREPGSGGFEVEGARRRYQELPAALRAEVEALLGRTTGSITLANNELYCYPSNNALLSDFIITADDIADRIHEWVEVGVKLAGALQGNRGE